MGEYVIKVPDIGEGIAEVELVAWHVEPGDAVEEDQTLADVMTDKASVEIPAPVAGRIRALGGKPGDVLAVGGELLRMEVEGAGNVAAAAAQPDPEQARPAPVSPTHVATPATPAPASPSEPPSAESEPVRSAPGAKPTASPAVRRRARDLGIDLQFVPGSGPHGRIAHEDLDAYVTRRGAPSPAAGGPRHGERNGQTIVPVIGLRRKIAQRMQEAKRRIPHFTYVEEVDVTDLEVLRAQLNATWETARGRLTLLPFLMRAIVRAVPSFPQVNARYDDDADAVTRYGAVHLGIATQTEGGLIVPVVRHAEARDLWSCAAEVGRLAEAARSGKIARDEVAGSTLTITSLGRLGGLVTTPVINYPEVAIVGVNRIVERPVIRAGAVVARSIMNLSSSFDHRVVDGMDAAQFVQALRGYLEYPATLFIDQDDS